VKNSFFTTGQVAKIFKVSRRAIGKWVDSGRLRGYRVPGSRHRRIPREYLAEFLIENGMDSKGLEKPDKVLIVTQNRVLIENLKKQTADQQLFRLEIASGSFDAGLKAEPLKPACIVVDFSIGASEALGICQAVRRNSRLSRAIIIVLLPDDGSSFNTDCPSINKTLKKPLDLALLLERLCTLTTS